MPGIFINYRTGDDHYGAILIDEQLKAHFGAEVVFRDSRTIPLGADFPPLLWKELRSSLAVIVVVGSEWLTVETGGVPRLFQDGDCVRREVKEALHLGIPVIPVVLGNAKFPTAADLPSDIANLAQRQYLRLDQRNPSHGIERLIIELERLTGLSRQANPLEPAMRAPSPSVMSLGDGATIHGSTQSHNVVRGDQAGRDVIKNTHNSNLRVGGRIVVLVTVIILVVGAAHIGKVI